MFSKILAGALGLGVVAVGGVMFHHYDSCPMSGGCKSRSNTEAVSTVTPGCCSDLSRSDAISCCSDESAEVSAPVETETLTIAPREVVK